MQIKWPRNKHMLNWPSADSSIAISNLNFYLHDLHIEKNTHIKHTGEVTRNAHLAGLPYLQKWQHASMSLPQDKEKLWSYTNAPKQ